MKKIFLALFAAIFCSTAAIYAESDIQIGLAGPAFNFSGKDFDLKNASLFGINLGNHNFFGETETLGFSDYISFSPLTSDIFRQFQGFNASAFIGPSFKYSPSEDKDLIVSAGFKYFMNYTRNVQELPKDSEEKSITITGTKIFSAYSFSVDLQMKFFADKRCSFILGLPFSAGMGNISYFEQVKAKNPLSHYRTLSSENDVGGFLELGFPYLMFGVNF